MDFTFLGSKITVDGCESWTTEKAESWRIDAFELLENTLESPLDCKAIKLYSLWGLKESDTSGDLHLHIHWMD